MLQSCHTLCGVGWVRNLGCQHQEVNCDNSWVQSSSSYFTIFIYCSLNLLKMLYLVNIRVYFCFNRKNIFLNIWKSHWPLSLTYFGNYLRFLLQLQFRHGTHHTTNLSQLVFLILMNFTEYTKNYLWHESVIILIHSMNIQITSHPP